MQTFGVLLLSVAVWVIYCGVSLISPWETALAIVADPGNATDVITKAKAEANGEIQSMTQGLKLPSLGDLFGGGGAGGTFNMFADREVSDDWDTHKARGDSAGGTDYPMPVGTPIISPFAGVLSNAEQGTLGYTATVRLANGWRFEAAHLSRFMDITGPVKPGSIIGWSGGKKGAEGSGSSTGPHVHLHMYDPNGVRRSFPAYMARGQK